MSCVGDNENVMVRLSGCCPLMTAVNQPKNLGSDERLSFDGQH